MTQQQEQLIKGFTELEKLFLEERDRETDQVTDKPYPDIIRAAHTLLIGLCRVVVEYAKLERGDAKR